MRFLLTCLLLVAIFSLGVYMGGNTSSENSSEPPVPEVEFVDATSIKEEVEESTVEMIMSQVFYTHLRKMVEMQLGK
mgnify:CR=1 FL=1